jgi:4'-phosphopantetheinyl transferase
MELSLSHSGRWAVVAVGRGAPVGVDVERLAGPFDPARLAARVLSAAELASYRGLAATRQRRAFVTYWTRKEAVLKATGEGLRVPPAALTVSPPRARPRLLDWSGRPDAPGRTHLYRLSPGSGHVATLAVLGRPPACVRELCVRLDVS